jgi:hypothetical protein
MGEFKTRMGNMKTIEELAQTVTDYKDENIKDVTDEQYAGVKDKCVAFVMLRTQLPEDDAILYLDAVKTSELEA